MAFIQLGIIKQYIGTSLCPYHPTVPQKGMNHRFISITVGKLVGGASAINALA